MPIPRLICGNPTDLKNGLRIVSLASNISHEASILLLKAISLVESFVSKRFRTPSPRNSVDVPLLL
jgi:hypothetical protein